MNGKSYLFNFSQRQENARVMSHIFALSSSSSPSTRAWPAGVYPGAGPSLPDNHDAIVAAFSGLKGSFKARVPPRRFLTPGQLVDKFEWTRAWIRRDISNFDYLMLLNSASGRTVNDLSQYPVFPWVLADYTSPTLDVDSPRPGMFRDLSKPIGALNPDRLRKLQQRRDDLMGDDTVIPFLYGSHYSNFGTVLYYLLRLEPYTTYSLALQSGKFDHADRLFHSVGESWRNVLTNQSDVKELVPEFYYLPEFLRNTRGLKLGTRQSGERLDDVILPPWANGSPDEFIRLNRAALESEYVSRHIQEWIDLVWGFQQQGPAAAAANNVFYHLTYEANVSKMNFANIFERRAIEAQVTNFGQTPAQLFTLPHPRRMTFDESLKEKWGVALSSALVLVRSAGARRRIVVTSHGVPVCAIVCQPGKGNVAAIDAAGHLSYHKYALEVDRDNGNLPFTWRPQSGPVLKCVMPHWQARYAAVLGLASERKQSQKAIDKNWAFGPVVGTVTTAWTSGIPGTAIPMGEEFVGAPRPSSATRSLSPSEGESTRGESPTTSDEPLMTALPPVLARPLSPAQACAGWGQHVVLLGDDDTMVRAGAWDGSVQCVSLSSGELLQRLRYHTRPVRCVAASEDRLFIACGCEDGTVTLWRCVPPAGLFDMDPSSGGAVSGVSGIGAVELSNSASGLAAVMDDFEGVKRTLGVFEDDAAVDSQVQLESSVSVGGGINVAQVMAVRREQQQKRMQSKGSIGFPALQAAALRYQMDLLYGPTASTPSSPSTPLNSLGIVSSGLGDALAKMFRGVSRSREFKPILQGHVAGGGPLLTLFGHTTPVTCVAVSQAVGIVVSASTVCLVHRLKDGALLRQLDPWSTVESGSDSASPLMTPPNCWSFLEARLGVRGFSHGVSISRVAVSGDGHVVVAAHKRLALFSSRCTFLCLFHPPSSALALTCLWTVCSTSGRLIRRVSTGGFVHTLLFSRSGRFVLTASAEDVSIRWTHSLRVYQVWTVCVSLVASCGECD